jgi:hypothetical protein
VPLTQPSRYSLMKYKAQQLVSLTVNMFGSIVFK